jgi:putative transposase
MSYKIATNKLHGNHKHALGKFIAFYKYRTTKQINRIRSALGMSVWQRNYYEHIIRNENELNEIRQYI